MRNFLAFILILCSLISFGQNKFDTSKEIGLSVGTSYYLGEINRQHFGGRLNVGGGIFFRNNFSRRWGMKLAVQYGKIEAFDEDSDDAWQVNRNLQFQNQIIEGSAQVELNYRDYQIGSKEDFWTPYLFIGLGYYSMNPKADYNGTLYELQPLGTEGQGTTAGDERYKLSGVSIPMGIGFKVNVYGIIALNLEWGMRRTFTDYLDDVSTNYASPAVLEDENGAIALLLADRSLQQEGAFGDNDGLKRGDPGLKDMYSFVNFTIAIRIDKKPSSCWK